MPQNGNVTQNIPEDWEDQGTSIPDGERNWDAQERPPADWFDYFFYHVIESLKELDANAILNVGGIPEIRYDVKANRPDPGVEKRLFISSDTLEVFIDKGSSWDLYSTLNSQNINYDNTDSGLNSTDVKNAIDEISSRINLSESGQNYNLVVVDGSLALEEV